MTDPSTPDPGPPEPMTSPGATTPEQQGTDAPTPTPAPSSFTASAPTPPTGTLQQPAPMAGITDIADMDSVLSLIIDDILQLPQNSIMRHQTEIMDVLDLVTMNKSEIEAISARINGVETKISKHDARLLVHFKWWHHDIASQMVNNDLPDDIWIEMDRHDFDLFRCTKVPSITSAGLPNAARPSTTSTPGDVDGNAVLQFQKSIKLDITQYPEFKGSLEAWLPFKRKLKAITVTHGIDRVIDEDPPVILAGTQDERLYKIQNNYLYSVFTQKLTGGITVLAMRQFEAAKDAWQVYLKLVEHYESTSNLMVISQKCHSKIQSLKLTRQFCGGAQAFVTQLQNAFLDLEYCTGVEKNDLEKKTTLLLAIEDSNYHAIRDNLAMDSDKDYLASLAAIDQHATMFITNNTQNPPRRFNNAESM